VGTGKDSLVTLKCLSLGKSEGLIFMACYLSLDDWKSFFWYMFISTCNCIFDERL